jgi:hypothetical protein
MSSADREALPRLEGWALLVPSGRRLLATPDSPAVVLTGTVSGHPRFPNGAAVVTSCVLELDLASAQARTRSGRYLLGVPSRVFLRWMRQHACGLEDFARTARDASRATGIEPSDPTTSGVARD